MERCDRVMLPDGRVVPMTAQARKHIADALESMAGESYLGGQLALESLPKCASYDICFTLHRSCRYIAKVLLCLSWWEGHAVSCIVTNDGCCMLSWRHDLMDVPCCMQSGRCASWPWQSGQTCLWSWPPMTVTPSTQSPRSCRWVGNPLHHLPACCTIKHHSKRITWRCAHVAMKVNIKIVAWGTVTKLLWLHGCCMMMQCMLSCPLGLPLLHSATQ